ncbi:MAG: hypothetical protein OHK0022_22150 [Roseiflexaceae bacterium]
MQAGFSEFSYSFAFMRELTNEKSAVIGTPLLPSTRNEGKLGYDVHIPINGIPVFLQFKLADYMKGSRSKYKEVFNKPHYRFNIYRRSISQQHNLLRKLASYHDDVYYVAPNFHLFGDFESNFKSNRIITKSNFFNLSTMPYTHTDEEYHIGFTQEDRLTFRWLPENHKNPAVPGEAWLSGIAKRTPKQELGIRYLLMTYAKALYIITEEGVQSTYIKNSLDSFIQFATSILPTENLIEYQGNYQTIHQLATSPKPWYDFNVFTYRDLQNYQPRSPYLSSTGMILEQFPMIVRELQTILNVYYGVEPVVVQAN